MAPGRTLVVVVLAEDVLPPLTRSTAFTAWEFDPWLTAGLVVIAALYVVGVIRLRRRGDRWPIGRVVSFLVGGVGVIAIATMSSLGAYDDTLFSVHMIQHMVLAMVAPVFLALGAPITLALRTVGPTAHRRILAILHSRFARVVTWPPVAWAHFVALPFALYLSAWYEATLRHNALHEWTHVQFVIAGCQFFWPILGIDPMPRRWGYPPRMLMTFLAIPFHAILGLSIMMQRTLIAGDYYRALHRTWGPTLAGDQNLAGGILWSSGDLVGLLFFGVLFMQWQRAEERSARRVDRRLDRREAVLTAGPVLPAQVDAVPGQVEPAPPVLSRPWWEVDPGPLAERARREGWRPSARPGNGGAGGGD